MRFAALLLLLTQLILTGSCVAQQEERLGVMFYNVENLMDTIDNPIKRDDEFVPDSEKQWNSERYAAKLNNLSRVISSAGIELPAIVGLSEVENKAVVEDLANENALASAGYQVIHFDSPDERGIDNALLIDPSRIKVLDAYAIHVELPANNGGSTRDILYACLMVKGAKEELHVFVNHWPSRYEGEEVSRPRRIMAASVLKANVDSLNELYEDPHIIIMGDMNDTPFDESVMVTLGASAMDDAYEDEALVNLVASYQKNNEGSYNYKGNWQALDQIIVSEILLQENSPVRVDRRKTVFVRNDFQMYESSKYGVMPSRTYGGPNYYGGYSDHLPVYTELLLTQAD
jgi:predicted extracellular nuclease